MEEGKGGGAWQVGVTVGGEVLYWKESMEGRPGSCMGEDAEEDSEGS
jgi:hypothetical protein